MCVLLPEACSPGQHARTGCIWRSCSVFRVVHARGRCVSKAGASAALQARARVMLINQPDACVRAKALLCVSQESKWQRIARHEPTLYACLCNHCCANDTATAAIARHGMRDSLADKC